MKKLLCILLVLSVLCSLSGCGKLFDVVKDVAVDGSTRFPGESEEEATVEKPIKHTGKKISGEICAASPFSEGLAFVELTAEPNKTYCIDKEGNIVFSLDFSIAAGSGNTIYKSFENGLVLVRGGIYNTTGKVTYPEDVGVTTFYDAAFSGGYILAERVTSDFSSAKKELGVMDQNFKWVVEPTEEAYAAAKKSLEFGDAINADMFFCNDYICFGEDDMFLNVKTGAVTDSPNIVWPAETWDGGRGEGYTDRNDRIMLDLSQYDTLYRMYSFVDGKGLITFYNDVSEKCYFTMIDDQGNFLFDPVEGYPTQKPFDGTYCLATDIANSHATYAPYTVFCYNAKGERVGELYTDMLPQKIKYWQVSDGVVLLECGDYRAYYNPDFTPLFE